MARSSCRLLVFQVVCVLVFSVGLIRSSVAFAEGCTESGCLSIAAVSPTALETGALVPISISGTGFNGEAQVYVDGGEVIDILSFSDSELIALIVAPSMEGTYALAVDQGNLTSVSPVGITVVDVPAVAPPGTIKFTTPPLATATIYPTVMPASFAAVVSVTGTTLSPEGTGIQYFINGTPVGSKTTATSLTYTGVPLGLHTLTAELVTAQGKPFNTTTSRTTAILKVQIPCTTAAQCEDANSCSNASCIGSICRYGLKTATCCQVDKDCPGKQVCNAGQCVECKADVNCVEGDICTADFCINGSCLHTATDGCCTTDSDCNDTNPCTIDTCDPNTNKCVNSGNNDPNCCFVVADCDDGDPCTAEACVGNICKFGPVAGCCYTTADCTSPLLCIKNKCLECGIDSDCDDGSACTADICGDNGKCQHISVVCNDQTVCTTDSCNPAVGCVFSPISCLDNDLCTSDGCHPVSGCIYPPADCDDNSVCTTDSCDPSVGCVHTSKSCFDNNLCTQDTCDPQLDCQFPQISCDDQNACTADSCHPATGCIHTPISCDDGNGCTSDSCDPSSGCVFVNNTLPCDDQSACSAGDTCKDGTCQGTDVECVDFDLCTIDSCDPEVGCVFTPTDEQCDDGDACTENDNCQSGTCQGSPTNCDDSFPCTMDGCEPINGCFHTFTEGCRGDLDGDNDINVTDATCFVYAFISWKEKLPVPECLFEQSYSHADVYCDGNINVQDLVILTYLVLDQPLPLLLDVNQDNIVDLCLESQP
ncbi:MAG: hypothetical protein HUU55_00325 [Myxococcales bacterium]|nr:hypothetical protein [Myxococcales bacterium]